MSLVRSLPYIVVMLCVLLLACDQQNATRASPSSNEASVAEVDQSLSLEMKALGLLLKAHSQDTRKSSALEHAIRALVVSVCGLQPIDKIALAHVENTPLEGLFPLERVSHATAAGCMYLRLDDGAKVYGDRALRGW